MIEMMRRRCMGGKEHYIPAEYQQVEFLEKNKYCGNCYIDTGIYITKLFDSKIIVFPLTEGSVNNDCYPILNRTNYSTGSYRRFVTQFQNNIVAYYLFGEGNLFSVNELNKKFILESKVINENDFVLSVTDEYGTQRAAKTALTIIGATQQLFIFRPMINDIDQSSGWNPNARIYYFYFNDHTNIRELIPCYRKVDKVPGMYDCVNGVFYTNAGTGSFIVGPDIN